MTFVIAASISSSWTPSAILSAQAAIGGAVGTAPDTVLKSPWKVDRDEKYDFSIDMTRLRPEEAVIPPMAGRVITVDDKRRGADAAKFWPAVIPVELGGPFFEEPAADFLVIREPLHHPGTAIVVDVARVREKAAEKLRKLNFRRIPEEDGSKVSRCAFVSPGELARMVVGVNFTNADYSGVWVITQGEAR